MRLLAIFAHPDDEAFSCGATLAAAAAAGHEVYLICATRGEEGEIVHPEIDAEAIPKGEARGALRETELQAACEALGIHPPIFLGHHDSGFPIEVGRGNPKAFMNQDPHAIEQELLPHIARIRPEVMITFDPHGGYGHIDHITIHRAALMAFWSAGSVMQPAPRRLYHPLRSIAQVEAMKAGASSSFDRVDPTLHGVSEDSFAAVIDGSALAERKRAALAAHRSQVGTLERVDAMIERLGESFTRERFVVGGLRGAFPAPPVGDLFAGLG